MSPAAPGEAARAIAFDLVEAVLERWRALDQAFGSHAGLGALAERDRAFVRTLAMATLRWLGPLDALIDGCLERPLPAQARRARHVLRLGAAQLVVLGTPAHAAVDGAVRSAEALGLGPYKGLINAVLRRLAREGAERLARLDAPRTATPDWLWRRWAASHGEATARAIATLHLAEPPLDLAVRADAHGWAERLGGTVEPGGAVRLPPGHGPIERIDGFDQGAWWVQDAAAQWPARLLGPVAGATVIDACAAPGGKTLQFAAAGARVIALDRSNARLARLRANCRRTGLEAESIAADVALWRPPEPVGHVLLDAPCSSTGTLRRHPDIAWTRRASDLPGLVERQQRLLGAALDWLAPGGTLVYAVCSLEPEEGVGIVERALAARTDIVRVPVTAEEVGGIAEAISAAGDLCTLPCHRAASGGMDGFYAARLRRRAQS